MTKETFVSTYYPLAKAAGDAFGLNPEVIMAQAAIESAWGSSYGARVRKNFFGITASGVSFNVPSSNCFSFEFIADDDIEKVNEKLVPVGLMFSKALIQQTFYKLETVAYQ